MLKRLVIVPICVISFLIAHLCERYDISTAVLKFTIDEVGGLFIKTIQFISSHKEISGLKNYSYYGQVLDNFYDNGACIDTYLVRSILKKHYITPDWIEDKPLGSGSIAQVHKGQWLGKSVVFKIQKPSARLEFMLDLGFIKLFLYLITLWIGEIPSTPFLHEFVDCVRREFDFNLEAQSMLKGKVWLEEFSEHIVVPMVRAHATRVLVMDYVEHIKIDGNDNNKCRILCRAFAKMILRHQFVHTDPHIGNICLTPNRQQFVIFDWGQHEILSSTTVQGLACIIRSDNVDMKCLRQGMVLCGIDSQNISIKHIMLVLDFFNHNNSVNYDYEKSWNLLRELVQHTAERQRGHRNPFKARSRELALILKTHDLLDVIMKRMNVPNPLRHQLFPEEMMRMSRECYQKVPDVAE